MAFSRKSIVIGGSVLVIASIIYYFLLPDKLFHDPYCTVLEDRKGELLSATIAKDGQWRFPLLDTVPDKFKQALIHYEDKRFISHWGIDIRAFARALRQNLQAGKVISGGSTITMQLVRLSRKGKGRTYGEKFIEIILATRLEFSYSKDEILALYASHAPFGGNVVGLEAACWRYFGRDVDELSWAEAALLTVLPNSPSLIHPGRNRDRLLVKRNALLDKLQQVGVLDEATCLLAKEEQIPDQPTPLPRHARHLIQRAVRDGLEQTRIRSTLDEGVQRRVEQIIDDHHKRLVGNQIYNAAALVLEVETGNVVAYVGNTQTDHSGYHGEEVDIINAPRSTGSILKPFLFAAMLDEGKILRTTLLPDVPTVINGFAPKNFKREFDGAVPADKALIRSLNIPAVYMLQQYRYEKFHSLLKDAGMTTLNRLPDHYGLALILGGAEGKLWDITGMYASMARVLNRYFMRSENLKYTNSDYQSPSYIQTAQAKMSTANLGPSGLFSASAIYQTIDVLKEVYRPGEETGWRNFYSAKKIAWKTGTSFGFRDGWAVGVTPQYAVGVWVGNADGEGRPGLTGTETAAPIMLDIFSQLPGNAWFQEPYMELEQIPVCSISGLRMGEYCEKADTTWVCARGLEVKPCTYHKKVHLTKDKRYRVHLSCETVEGMVERNWFVLSPIQEHYFRPRNISYKILPPFKPGCEAVTTLRTMDMVYPKQNARLFIPRELDGTPGSSVFELAHRNPQAVVFWHLNDQYLGNTLKNHRFPLNPGGGRHLLTLVDDSGETLEIHFEVVSK
ncbi:MAG: penicillin-binding protein 1C [Cyclobacteriaceae bacterium]|nr:penicillin-binding protein 1C [Cyclobacteriaceae bacterium]UYN86347.1 MAG: penicillin-binding protein 1C [Cyclobacteriaceae bacterium]